MSISTKTKLEAVTEKFGVPPDPEDVDYINFMYARRGLATVPGRCGRDPCYIVELQDLEMVIWETLDRIYERDGARFWREAGSYLANAVTVSMRNPPARRRAELQVAA
jgi:hypothetical protein